MHFFIKCIVCYYVLNCILSYSICVRPEAGYDCVEWQVTYLPHLNLLFAQTQDLNIFCHILDLSGYNMWDHNSG